MWTLEKRHKNSPNLTSNSHALNCSMHRNYESFFRGKPNGLAHNHRLGLANTLKSIAKQEAKEEALKASIERADMLVARAEARLAKAGGAVKRQAAEASLSFKQSKAAALRKRLEDCRFWLKPLRDKVGEHEYEIHHLERLDPGTHASLAYLVHYTVHHPGKAFPRYDFDAVSLGFEKFDAGKLVDVRRDGLFLGQITQQYTEDGNDVYYELTDAAKEPRGFYDLYLRYLDTHPAAPRAR